LAWQVGGVQPDSPFPLGRFEGFNRVLAGGFIVVSLLFCLELLIKV
jgi:hypothetical protein